VIATSISSESFIPTAEAKVTVIDPPPAGTVATPVLLVVPLLMVAESEPVPQAEAIPATATTVTLFPVSTWVTVTPSVSHRATLARPAPTVVLAVPMVVA
jgi:hypothetical protein